MHHDVLVAVEHIAVAALLGARRDVVQLAARLRLLVREDHDAFARGDRRQQIGIEGLAQQPQQKDGLKALSTKTRIPQQAAGRLQCPYAYCGHLH